MSKEQPQPRKVTDWDCDTAQLFLDMANLDQAVAKDALSKLMATYRENQQALGIFVDGAPVT